MGKQTVTSGLEWNTMLGLAERLKKDKEYKDYLLIVVGCHFGLRASDLLSIKWVDVFDSHSFIITEGKTSKQRCITINERVKEALVLGSQFLNPNGTKKYIFSNRWDSPMTVSYLNKRLKLIMAKYRVKTQNPSSHTLRKTFGKRVYEMDGQSERALIQLSEIFGHSSTAITRRYIGITQEMIADVYLGL